MIQKTQSPGKARAPKAPHVEISAKSGQRGSAIEIDYCIDAPKERSIYIYADYCPYIIEWPIKPGICLPFEERHPLIYRYCAMAEEPGLSIGGFVAPDVECLEAGKSRKGKFSVPDAIDFTDAAPNGEPVVITDPIPPQFDIQMVVAWSEKPLEIPFDHPDPRAAFIAWQKAANSNRLTFRRDYCWEEQKRGRR